MTEQRGLLQVVSRMVADEAFRKRLMIAPKETLTTELGISKENVEALVALLPVLLAGGFVILGDVLPPGLEGTQATGWGGWSR